MSQKEYPEVSVHEEDAQAFMSDLRESGECNMLASGSHLQEEFGISRSEAKQIVCWWISQ